MQAHLTQAGHRVLVASSGAGAVAAVVEKGAWDVAVLDIRLPDMHGFDLARKLRGVPGCEALRIVFLSANVDQQHIDDGRDLDAVYLTKPYVRNALCAAVQDRRRAIRCSPRWTGTCPGSCAPQEEWAMKSRLWWWYALGILLAAGVYFALPSERLTQSLLFVGIHLASLVALVVGVRLYRPRHAGIWYLIAVGFALYAAGNVIWYVYPVASGRALPFPSVADAIYLCAYSVLLIGLGLLVRTRQGGRDRAGLIDTAIVTLGLGTLSWIFFMGPAVTNDSLSVPARLTSLAYPLIDVLLLGILVRLLLSPGGHLPAYRLLALALAAQLFADIWYSLTSLQGSFAFGAWWFAGYFVIYLASGAMALHPSMRELSEPAPHQPARLTGRRLGFLTAAALVGPVVHAYADTESLDDAVLAGATIVLFLLVLGRMRGLLVEIAEHERMKGLQDEFTSMVSHELRTPITSIRGALGLVAGGALGPIPDKAQRMLDIAHDNTERLVRLINDILDIERMSSGQIALEKVPCRTGELVARASDALRAMAEEAGVTLLAKAEDAAMSVDEDRMMQVLTNLVNNAVKFSPRGGTVRLTAECLGKDVVFRVSDDGPGIPREQLELIFAPFHQVDSSDSRAKGGTGLGLAVCRGIVGQHGGRIWAENNPVRGARFSVSVPGLASWPVAESGPLVLICDDDASIREVVAAILQRQGYRVVTAATAEEALEVAIAQQPSTILLDLFMPRVSGWVAAAMLKERPETRDIPVVILSVLAEREADAVAGNVVDWVQKPLEEGTLFRALENAVCGPHKPARVLVVENDLDLARVLTTTLERKGVEVFHAADGPAAIEVSERVMPDLVVLDLLLPGLDGFAIVDRMRRHDRLRLAPLLVYTVADLDDADRRRLRLGHTEFLTKGAVTPQDFEDRVTRLLEGSAGAALQGSGHAA